jgi:hypothetical protein
METHGSLRARFWGWQLVSCLNLLHTSTAT